ncbi:hypothetical protein FB567DRAFT_626429 [Paraphoma chrysanthemicola]|uniref:Uncharacterized protein n=1 Tax=Paraphoma chrysanthemicola TaxID=798071 RepID=A0A8K0W1W7_9PLEO|nr:hypothetical protein FB567DRAFT_626429 [Paraphoma chrysanthemicola]
MVKPPPLIRTVPRLPPPQAPSSSQTPTASPAKTKQKSGRFTDDERDILKDAYANAGNKIPDPQGMSMLTTTISRSLLSIQHWYRNNIKRFALDQVESAVSKLDPAFANTYFMAVRNSGREKKARRSHHKAKLARQMGVDDTLRRVLRGNWEWGQGLLPKFQPLLPFETFAPRFSDSAQSTLVHIFDSVPMIDIEANQDVNKFVLAATTNHEPDSNIPVSLARLLNMNPTPREVMDDIYELVSSDATQHLRPILEHMMWLPRSGLNMLDPVYTRGNVHPRIDHALRPAWEKLVATETQDGISGDMLVAPFGSAESALMIALHYPPEDFTGHGRYPQLGNKSITFLLAKLGDLDLSTLWFSAVLTHGAFIFDVCTLKMSYPYKHNPEKIPQRYIDNDQEAYAIPDRIYS